MLYTIYTEALITITCMPLTVVYLTRTRIPVQVDSVPSHPLTVHVLVEVPVSVKPGVQE